jgi:hypothetical protein
MNVSGSLSRPKHIGHFSTEEEEEKEGVMQMFGEMRSAYQILAGKTKKRKRTWKSKSVLEGQQ